MVDDSLPQRQLLKFNLCQPITVQVFPARQGSKTLPTLHHYSTHLELWTPVPGNVWSCNIYTLPLPLTQIPVFKLADVTVTVYAGDYAVGGCQVQPLCSMKKMFVPHLDFT